MWVPRMSTECGLSRIGAEARNWAMVLSFRHLLFICRMAAACCLRRSRLAQGDGVVSTKGTGMTTEQGQQILGYVKKIAGRDLTFGCRGLVMHGLAD